MTDLPNPYAAPVSLANSRSVPLPNAGSILIQSAMLLGNHWGKLLAIIAVVWGPVELLVGYFEYSEYGETGWFFLVMFFSEMFVGAVASAAVIAVARMAAEGEAPRAKQAAAVALRRFVPLGITTVLWSLIVMLGTICFVLPGLFLMARLSLTDAVVVNERAWGLRAMIRSMELTSGYFWPLLGLCLLFMTISMAPWFIFLFIAILWPHVDSWVTASLFALLMDIVGVYSTICLYLVYRRLNQVADFS